MIDTLTRFLQGVRDVLTRENLRSILTPMVDRTSTQMMTSAGLVIKSGGSTLAKSGASDVYAVVQGKLVKLASGTDMSVLAGVITAASFNVFVFSMDSAGVITTAMGTESTTVGGVVFPPLPQGKVTVGFLIVTHSGTFTGGTTALDTATTVYVNVVGDFDPSVLV